MLIRRIILFALIIPAVVGGSVFGLGVLADEDGEAAVNSEYHINLDQPTIARGYTVSAFDELKLSLVPGILSEATPVEIIRLDEPMDMPWKLDLISHIYQFEFKNKAAYDDHKPFYIQFAYTADDSSFKRVFFFDKNYGTWRPLPTRDYPKEMFVRSLIHLPFARIAVFSDPDVLTVGRASWYGYKGGNYAASPDFPKGSRLRVYSTADSDFVDVEINDYGPDRSIFPDRAIDLDKVAFAQIAPLGAGVIDVKVEPLGIIPDVFGRIMGIPATGIGTKPALTATSAVVIVEDSGETLLSYNATATLPVASLTKLVAVKVFLDTRPSLDRVVTYSTDDEEYNYEHCKRWESSKVALRNGETLTVEDLLYVSLVGSANNTVETLVRVSGMARPDFIAEMNRTVASIGATSTNFTEPTGLSPENVSSAAEYAIISKEVFKHPIIEKASTMLRYSFITVNTGRYFSVRNTDQILNRQIFDFTGSKTGYLDEAGYCLVTRVSAGNGRQVIAVIMGADTREGSFYEMEELIRFGLRRLER